MSFTLSLLLLRPLSLSLSLSLSHPPFLAISFLSFQSPTFGIHNLLPNLLVKSLFSNLKCENISRTIFEAMAAILMTDAQSLPKPKSRTKGREPWSSGYGRRLMFQRSWVRIPAPYTGWTFVHIYLL